MSKTVVINSKPQFNDLLKSSTIVVTDFHATWCAPCKTIAPLYEQLSAKLSRTNKITFTKVDVDQQPDVAQEYGISAMPTFMIFKNTEPIKTIRGADPNKLRDAVQQLAKEAESSGTGFSGSGSSSGAAGSGDTWLGAALPRNYADITNEVDTRGLDLLNADSAFGHVRCLFESSKPSGRPELGKGKGKKEEKAGADWVESDTDQQLMLYIPFMATVKVHTLHITSLPPNPSEDENEEDEEEQPMRPKTLQIYSNRAHVLGFDEAEGVPATQTITLREQDWDAKTGTAKVELRFVKFQNVTSLVVFVVDGDDADGESETVRIDRIRVIGEAGGKRDLGKLEKIGDEPGE